MTQPNVPDDDATSMSQPTIEQLPTAWGCDVPISMPVPIDSNQLMIDMGSHAFTVNGLFINMNTAVLQESFAPTYGPAIDPQ